MTAGAAAVSADALPEGIDRLRSGRLRARANLPGKGRVTVGVYDTAEEAVAVRAEFLARIKRDVAKRGADPTTGLSLADWKDKWFDRREKIEKKRGIRQEKDRWKKHVETAKFYRVPMRWVTRAMWMEWLDIVQTGRAEQTSKNVLNLVRCALGDAIKFGHLDTNPLLGVKVAKVARVGEPWTFLTPAEQDALTRVVPEDERWVMRFALGTGLRLGELGALHIEDLITEGKEPRVIVKFGSIVGGVGQPTKSGKTRVLALNGIALEAAKRWLAHMPSVIKENPLKLVFPTKYGAVRRRAPRAWGAWLKEAGIHRRVRWHDLRHSCATSLICGWWGHRWSTEEIKQQLGHASVTTSERYAHLGDDILKAPARATVGYMIEADPDPEDDGDDDDIDELRERSRSRRNGSSRATAKAVVTAGSRRAQVRESARVVRAFVNRRSWVQIPWLAQRPVTKPRTKRPARRCFHGARRAICFYSSASNAISFSISSSAV